MTRRSRQLQELPVVSSAGPWYRVHLADRDPKDFGKQGLFRFDAPSPYQGLFQTCYLGCSPAAAFLETLGGIRPLPERLVNERLITKLSPGAPVHVADFTDSRVLASLGLDFDPYIGDYVDLCLDRPSSAYSQTQQFALHLWRSGIKGVQYFASHQQRPGELSVALFSPPLKDLSDLDVKAAESYEIDAPLLLEVQRHFGFEIFPDDPMPW